MILLYMLLLTAIFIGVLWFTTVFFQAYLYNTVVEGLRWRAPAAGLALGLFVGMWCYLDSRSPGSLDTIFNFTTGSSQVFDEIVAIQTVPGVEAERKIPYRRAQLYTGKSEYRNEAGQVFTRSSSNFMVTAIEVNEKGKSAPTRFVADLKERIEQTKNAAGEPTQVKITVFKIEPNQPLYFREVGGRRVMSDDRLGIVEDSSFLMLVANIILNFAHLAIWFAVLWLLLEYGWQTALGLAAIAWLGMTLVVMPIVLAEVRKPVVPAAVKPAAAPEPAADAK